jgi:hypothetical protein
MKASYKLTYEIREDDINSKNYGYIIPKVKRFPSLEEAVRFGKSIANTCAVIGKPMIEGN